MYKLTLTAKDIETIAFVGGRYCWSDSLRHLSEGEHDIPEHKAWAIREAFDADTEGGHSMFPMLDSRSELCDKLFAFYESIL